MKRFIIDVSFFIQEAYEKHYATAILRYEGSPDPDEDEPNNLPQSKPIQCNESHECIVVNCPTGSFPPYLPMGKYTK